MAGTAPSRGKTATSKTSGRASQRSEELLPPLIVRYMRRMKRQRVYSCEVSWQTSKKKISATEPVTVRLIMAGAQIVPSEHTLDPAKPKSGVVFYVTPLALGGLRGGRMEILQGGKKVQEMKLPARVVTQRMTWVLLALTFLVPWFLLTYIRPAPTVTEPMPRQHKAKAAQQPDRQEDEGPKLPEMRVYKSTPGYLLERSLEEHCPPVLAVVEEHVPDVGDALREVPSVLKSSVDYVHFQSLQRPVVYWTVACLLGLTLLSAFVHRDKRKRRVSQPLPVPQIDLDL